MQGSKAVWRKHKWLQNMHLTKQMDISGIQMDLLIQCPYRYNSGKKKSHPYWPIPASAVNLLYNPVTLIWPQTAWIAMISQPPTERTLQSSESFSPVQDFNLSTILCPLQINVCYWVGTSKAGQKWTFSWIRTENLPVLLVGHLYYCMTYTYIYCIY